MTIGKTEESSKEIPHGYLETVQEFSQGSKVSSKWWKTFTTVFQVLGKKNNEKCFQMLFSGESKQYFCVLKTTTTLHLEDSSLKNNF